MHQGKRPCTDRVESDGWKGSNTIQVQHSIENIFLSNRWLYLSPSILQRMDHCWRIYCDIIVEEYRIGTNVKQAEWKIKQGKILLEDREVRRHSEIHITGNRRSDEILRITM